MPEINLTITIASFIAGVFTFLAPCTLPLVPAFLGVISGSKLEDFKDPEKAKLARRALLKNAVFYVLGFSLIFILFGAAFSFVGQLLFIKIWLPRIGGVFVLLFGLILLGWLKIPWLSSEQKLNVPHLFRKVSLVNSFLLGVVFSLGWSPCVGPLLGTVLLLASTSSTFFEGTFLLVIFSAGLGLPFILTALLIGRAFSAFVKWGKTLEMMNKIAGIFLVFLGILLVIGKFSEFHNKLIIYFYRWQMFETFVNKFL